MDLAGYAHQLDEEEQATMAEGGLMNPEFLRFMQVMMMMMCGYVVWKCCISLVSSNRPAIWTTADSSQCRYIQITISDVYYVCHRKALT